MKTRIQVNRRIKWKSKLMIALEREARTKLQNEILRRLKK